MHAIWSYFFNKRLSTCKDLPFTSFQRSLMLSMFLATFFFCKACHFCLHCKVLSNMLTYFLVTSGYSQSHSNSHLLNAQFVNVIQKVHLLNCVDGNREYSVSLKTARMREDKAKKKKLLYWSNPPDPNFTPYPRHFYLFIYFFWGEKIKIKALSWILR